MILDDLITLEQPENQKALRHVKTLFVGKLLLLAVLLPVPISFLMELYEFISIRINESRLPELLPFPLLHFVFQGIFVSIIALVLLAIITILAPLFSFVLVPLWWLIFFVIGLLFELIVVVPRIFLGATLDLLLNLLTKKKESVLFTGLTSLLLLVGFILVSASSGHFWIPWHRELVAHAKEKLPPDVTPAQMRIAEVWGDRIDSAYRAKTMDNAYDQLYGLVAMIPRLSYYNKVERGRLENTVFDALKNLRHCRDYKLTSFKDWNPDYRESLDRLDLMGMSDKHSF